MNELEELRENITNDYKFFEIILDHFDITENILIRLVEKQEKYGDGWINCSITPLREKINKMYKLYKIKRGSLHIEQKALLDLINQSILLLIRLKQENNFLKDYD